VIPRAVAILLRCLLLVLAAACGGEAASTPPAQNAGQTADAPPASEWPIQGEIVRDKAPPHGFHASRDLSYPELTAAMFEPKWTSSDAPVGTLSIWFHLGSGEVPSGTHLKLVSWDNDMMHHCVHEKVDAPSAEARYVETVRGQQVFPAKDGAGALVPAVSGELVLVAPSSMARGVSGSLDVTLTDPRGHVRHITATVKFDAPKEGEMWSREARECPKE